MQASEPPGETPPAPRGSVSQWLSRLKAGDPGAAQPLWERYFRRLVGLARRRLRRAPCRASDEEDIALSVLDSFCRAAAAGRFPRLNDRHDLWHLLVTLTARKAYDRAHHERRRKRGGGVRGEQEPAHAGGRAAQSGGLAELVGREPTPEFAALVADECNRLLGRLPDDGLRAIALRKMEGYTNEEIAAQAGLAPATVERRLRLIRKIWEGELER
jgi:DNA-directed RNA polymerase specialized sigma24 family protein